MSAQMHMQVVLLLGLAIPSLTVRVFNLSEVTMSASGSVTPARPQTDTMTDFTITFYEIRSCDPLSGYFAGEDTTITVQFLSGEWRSREIQFLRMTTDHSKKEVISIRVPFADLKEQHRHINIKMKMSQPGTFFGNYHCGGEKLSATSLGLPPDSKYGVGITFGPKEGFPMACTIAGKRRAPEPAQEGRAPRAHSSKKPPVAKPAQKNATHDKPAKPIVTAPKVISKPAQKIAEPAKSAESANHSQETCEICKSKLCNQLAQTKDVTQFSAKFNSICSSHPTCQQCGVTCEDWPFANIPVGCETKSKNSFFIAMTEIWKAVKNAEVVEKKILELAQAAAQATEHKEGGCYSGIAAARPNKIKKELGYNPKEGVEKKKRIVDQKKWNKFKDPCEKSKPHGKGFKCVAVADKFRFTYPGQGTGLAPNRCGDVQKWYNLQMRGKNTGTDCDNYWKQCMKPKKTTPDLDLDPRICGNPGTYTEVHLAVCTAVKVEDAKD